MTCLGNWGSNQGHLTPMHGPTCPPLAARQEEPWESPTPIPRWKTRAHGSLTRGLHKLSLSPSLFPHLCQLCPDTPFLHGPSGGSQELFLLALQPGGGNCSHLEILSVIQPRGGGALASSGRSPRAELSISQCTEPYTPQRMTWPQMPIALGAETLVCV